MEQNTYVNEDEREIDMKVLFAYIVKGWKMILIGALIFGMLIAGYKILKGTSSSSTSGNSDTGTDTVESINAEIENTKNAIKYLNDYMQDSVYANIDPFNEVVTSSTVSIVYTGVSSNAAVTNGLNPAAQVAYAYETYIKNELDYSSISKELNLTEQELKEIIYAKSDFDSNTVTIKVIGNDSQLTEKVMEFINKNVSGYKSQLTQNGQFTVILSKSVTNIIVDQQLLALYPTSTDAVPASPYTNNLVMSNAIARKAALKTALSTEQKSLDTVKAEVANTSKNSVKSAIKYGGIGFVIGLLIMFGILALRIISSGKILSENDLKRSYGIKTLSVLPMKRKEKKLSKFEQKIYRRIDCSYNVCEDVAIEKAIANISCSCNGKQSLLLVGCDLQQNVLELQEKLQKVMPNIVFNSSDNIDANAGEIQKLKNAEGIIIIAERNHTVSADLSNIIESCIDWKKPIIGSIVL